MIARNQRLRILAAAAAGRCIANMSDCGIARQFFKHEFVKDLLHQPHIFILKDLDTVVLVLTVDRDAAALLSSVLQGIKAVICQP